MWNVVWLFACAALLPAIASAGEHEGPGVVLAIPDKESRAAVDARLTRLVALYVPQGQPPSMFTSVGPFHATFEGDISLRLREQLTFSAEGAGTFKLTINGKVALEASGSDLSQKAGEPIRLNKGKNHFVTEYESPATGDASLRLFWAGQSFRREPVPPTVLSHAGLEPAVSKSLTVREGRFLFIEYRCGKCHATDAATRGNLEATIDAPSLTEAGARLNAAWIAAWLKDPKSVRPDAHMPRVLTGPNAEQEARDIAAYLASLGGSPNKAPAGNSDDGGRVFANLECVACHATPDKAPDDASLAGRVPLAQVKAKFKPGALVAYLTNPQSHYAWNPMPNFRLSEEEAADLSAFLLSFDVRTFDESPGDPAKGKLLAASSGCLNCHAIGETKSTLVANPLASLHPAPKKGCLADDASARGKAPDFRLSGEQREALVAFLETDRISLSRTSAPEFAERQFVTMRCGACHARDRVESAIATTLELESQALHQKYPNPKPTEAHPYATDQRPPMLTWAGEKLRPQWMGQFIQGKVSYKPRYFLYARMPAFPAVGQRIAEGFAEEHGCAPELGPLPRPGPDAEAGRKLVSKVPNMGFSCVQCHAVADDPPFAPFEAPSVNFMYVAERLRHDYYLRWMHDPLRIDPATKMPRFDDAEGKTGITAIFNGDAGKQFEAIWQYLLSGREIQPPPQ